MEADPSEDSTRTLAADGFVTVRFDGAVLEVVEGTSLGATLQMTTPAVIVGSGEGADLRIADRGISRRHFELRSDKAGLVLRDLGSHNGTFVQGCRIGEAIIISPTVITAGKSRISVRPAKSTVALELTKSDAFGEAIGQSVVMRHVFATLAKAAKTDATVLLQGESGTGKEVLAEGLHARSRQAAGPFVVVDCASLPENLIESELFGHERGAFTGAHAQHIGAFERANGGTIFLDELGELPLSQQAKLLRVIENRTIQRLGGNLSIPVEVRIIAATNVDLDEAVRKGAFRSDLYYRISVLSISIPPLRERADDIPLLARRFYRRFAQTKDELPADILTIFMKHPWPGNVRELRNAVERWVALGSPTHEAFLGPRVNGADEGVHAELTYHDAKRRALEAFERAYFPAVLARAGGVVAKAAELAGVPRPSFHRMLARARGDE